MAVYRYVGHSSGINLDLFPKGRNAGLSQIQKLMCVHRISIQATYCILWTALIELEAKELVLLPR